MRRTLVLMLCITLASAWANAIVEETGIQMTNGDSIEEIEEDEQPQTLTTATEFTPLDSRALQAAAADGSLEEEERNEIIRSRLEDEEREERNYFVPTTPTSAPMPQYSFEVPSYVPTTASASFPGASSTKPMPEQRTSTITQLPIADDDLVVKDQAFEMFQQMLGLTNRSSHPGPEGPAPEFMVDLYNTVTDSYGITRAKNPFSADVVRAVMERRERAVIFNDYFYFSLSDLEEGETLLEAELHIYREPIPHSQLHPSLYLTPFCILSLYQVVDSNPKHLAVPDLHKLLGVHYVPALGSGWEVFNVTQVIHQWLDGGRNHGFLIAATSLGGDKVPVKFTRRWDVDPQNRNASKQPILVMFTKDSKYHLPEKEAAIRRPVVAPTRLPAPSTADDNDDEDDMPNSLPDPGQDRHIPTSIGRFRSRRSKNHTDTTGATTPPFARLTMEQSCGKADLLITLETLGWSSWIISPRTYNAFYCRGSCSFPLSPRMNPTKHATIQSIIHRLNMIPGLPGPCCVPNSLLPLSLLYYQDADNVVLKQYGDMVVQSCSCV